MRYSLDASSIIQAWTNRYPVDVFPRFWEDLDGLIQCGDLRASEEVYAEIKRKEDGLFEWIQRRDRLVMPIDEATQEAVTEILAAHPFLVEEKKGRSGADPFVIALAKVNDLTVVTEEKPSPNATRRPKIPDVCGAYGIRHTNVLGVIRENGWRYGGV
jgi:hypothetical protein